MTLSDSNIEYLNFQWNIATGCDNQATGFCDLPCWARALYSRFGKSFAPVVNARAVNDPLKLAYVTARLTIGVAFTGDLIIHSPGTSIPGHGTLQEAISGVMRATPQHRYLVLTKRIDRLQDWQEWPSNAIVGVSASTIQQMARAEEVLAGVKAAAKWLSLEPLLDVPPYAFDRIDKAGIKWVVIGAATGPKADMQELARRHGLSMVPYARKYSVQPERQWVEHITAMAHARGAAVWMKNNLRPLMGKNLIQEDTP